MSNLVICIARDFSAVPGARYPDEGDFSGEDFRKKVLIPKLIEAKSLNVQLLIDLDGTAGYGTSFLEEVFGGLIRIDNYTLDELNNLLDFKSDEDPEYINEIKSYMKDAEDNKKDNE